MGALDLQRVHEAGHVVGPDFHVVGLDGLVGLPVAAHVEVDAAEVPGRDRSRGGEVEVAEARAVDVNHGRAFPRRLVPELDAVDLRERHDRLPFVSLARRERRSYTGKPAK